MLRSAIKASSQSRTPSHHGPMPNADSWSAPSDWDQAPFHLSAPSSTSLLSSVDTVTTGSSKTVGFAASSNVSFDTASSGTRDPSAPFGGQAEGKIVLRVYRFHSKMKTAYSLLVDERTEDPVFYIDYSQRTSSAWSCRVFRGQDTSGDLLFSVRRTGLSSKFEIVRHHNGETLTTTLSGSGMIKKKWSFKGYDGNSFAWKEQTGGWELLGYKADKAKTKVCLGKYLSGTNSMKADSTGTVEATNDPRLAELCFIVIFAVEDDMITSTYASHGGPTVQVSSDDDLDHR